MDLAMYLATGVAVLLLVFGVALPLMATLLQRLFQGPDLTYRQALYRRQRLLYRHRPRPRRLRR